MRIEHIDLRHFLSHRDTVFRVPDFNPIVIVGDNGAGKSSLVKDSLTWALFGKARGNGDELITVGETRCEVLVHFTLSGTRYGVLRTRELGKKTDLELFRVDSVSSYFDLSGATIAETQEKINKLLGMTYDVFVNTACIEQGKAGSFTALTPKEAKQLLMRILCLDVYEDYLAEVRRRIAVSSAQVDALQSQAQTYSHDLELLRVNGVAEKAEAVKELNARFEWHEKVEGVIRENIRLLEMQVSETKVQIGATSTLMEGVAKEISKGNLKLKRLAETDGECPLCFSKLSRQQLDDLSVRIAAENESRGAEFKGLSRTLMILKGELASLESRLDGEVMRQSERSIERDRVAQEMEVREKELEGLKVQHHLGNLLREKQMDLEKEIASHEAILTSLRYLERAFDAHGIPSLIIENTLPEVEETANSILDLLSEHQVRLELRTQKSLRSGGVGDTLQVVILPLTNPGTYGTLYSERNYQALSGGEAYRVDLALRLALSKVLARRNSFKCETLIVDEGLGSLDGLGRHRFVELSRLLGETFKRIFIITHTEVMDMYKQTVQVEKKGETSVVSLND